MCGFEVYSKIFLWMFLGGSACMAIISRKLNDHLLKPPPPPKHLWFRKKNHIKPLYLLKPDLYFDKRGQGWAWRFTLVSALTLLMGIMSFYTIFACR
ncbi:MAG: hypothetical protein CMM44_00310 [Rhodospirillaceae bacterium]|nr:hypothetical protein [Rhodospirillaceae bacterium]